MLHLSKTLVDTEYYQKASSEMMDKIFNAGRMEEDFQWVTRIINNKFILVHARNQCSEHNLVARSVTFSKNSHSFEDSPICKGTMP